jgi:hypothetical protein
MRPFLILLPLGFVLIGRPHAAAPNPNIIVILTEDQGWADLRCRDASVSGVFRKLRCDC